MRRSRLEEMTPIVFWLVVLWYFFGYVGTGITPKIFTKGLFGVEKISDTASVYYSTLGSIPSAILVMFLLGWYKRPRNFPTARVGRLSLRWFVYVAISGFCTSIIIVTTTMMYCFNVSVMLAMIMMRGCVVVDGRVVDALHVRFGILDQEVNRWENYGVILAVEAVLTGILKPPRQGEKDPFTLFQSVPAMITLGLYVIAYLVRLYIMNWYKRTEGANTPAYIWAEQAFAALFTVLFGAGLLLSGSHNPYILQVQNAAECWNWLAIAGGIPFGLAAIPSILLFMNRRGNATRNTLINRLTSLLGGTTSTLILAALFSLGWIAVTMDWPAWYDGLAFVAILAALVCLWKGDSVRGQTGIPATARA